MRYASAGTKMVQKFTMEEKSSLFGMLDRIEKVVNDSYTREAMPKLVKKSQDEHMSNVQPIFATAGDVGHRSASQSKRAVGSDSNVIDVSLLALSRGESVGESNILKMGENVILVKRESGDAVTPVQNRFPPEFYMYFDIKEDGQHTTPPTPREVA